MLFSLFILLKTHFYDYYYIYMSYFYVNLPFFNVSIENLKVYFKYNSVQ